MTNNYQSIYTGEEIDRGIGFANNTLSLLYTIPVLGNFDNLMVGSQGSTSSSGFSRAPMVENVFSGIGRSSDNILFSFVGKITNAADPYSIKFDFLQLNKISSDNPFLGMLAPTDPINNRSFVNPSGTTPSLTLEWRWADNAVYFVTVNWRPMNNLVVTDGAVEGTGIIVTSSDNQHLYIPTSPTAGFFVDLYTEVEGNFVRKRVSCGYDKVDGIEPGLAIDGFRVSFRRLV